MKARNLLLSIIAAGSIALPALTSAQVFIPVSGEAGFIINVNPTPGMTREQKRAQDRADAQAEAKRADGFRYVGGEAGWAFVGHEYARVNGEWVCVDGIDHATVSDRGAVDQSIYTGA
jgi:hypothetical protein